MRFFVRYERDNATVSDQFEFRAEDFQRVNIVGTSASGKTTFGKQLAEILDVPYVEMDTLFHEPNWTEAPLEVFRERLARAIEQPRWILDGNYHSKTVNLKLGRATMVIWLDMPFSLNLYRAFCRATNRAWTQKELWPGTGNRESFRQTFFSTDSMILWTAKSYWRLKKRYSEMEKSVPEDVTFIRLRGAKEVRQFLEHVEAIS